MAASRLSIKVEECGKAESRVRPAITKNHQRTTDMANTEDKIPAELVRELRTLAHDLSNALETIVQAAYLISQAGPPENSRRWVEMIDQASHDAVKINNKLREILRAHS